MIPAKYEHSRKTERINAILTYVANYKKERTRHGEELTYAALIEWVRNKFKVATSTARKYIEEARQKEREKSADQPENG